MKMWKFDKINAKETTEKGVLRVKDTSFLIKIVFLNKIFHQSI